MKKYTILPPAKKLELYMTYANSASITQAELAEKYGIAMITVKKIIKRFRKSGEVFPTIWS